MKNKTIIAVLVAFVALGAFVFGQKGRPPEGTWQYSRYELTGNFIETQDVPVDWGTPKAYPGYALAMSQVENGYTVIVGTDLDAIDPTDARIRAVAISGVVVKHNISDFE